MKWNEAHDKPNLLIRKIMKHEHDTEKIQGQWKIGR